MPALMQKSLWYALSWQDVHDNLRSLFWGLGFHAYAVAWWMAPANRFLNANGLIGRFPEALVDQWYKQGRERGAWHYGKDTQNPMMPELQDTEHTGKRTAIRGYEGVMSHTMDEVYA